MSDDERVRSHIHDMVVAGSSAEDIAEMLVPKATLQRVITTVMADYVSELNRALASGDGALWGQDASSFMRQYDVLWQAKLLL